MKKTILVVIVGLLFVVSTLAQGPTLPPIDEVPGTLLIAGGGSLPDPVRERFVAVAGGKDAEIVVIPTASQDADNPKAEASFLTPWQKKNPKSVVLLHTRDPKKANDPDFITPLQKATAVWFSGGDQSRITSAYAGTLVEKELRNLLQRGGLIGGTSAGAAIMSDVMITGGNPKASTSNGFGFLPGFVVDQHFLARKRKDRLVGVLQAKPGYVGLGIDESTAALVKGRRIEVLGASSSTVILSPGAGKPISEIVLKSGEKADLFQLRRAAANRASDASFPPEKVPDPIVPDGSLIIIGGGGVTEEIMERFITLAGGKDALIVGIPTASEQEISSDDPSIPRFLRRYGATNVKVLHTRDRKQANDPAFSKVLLQAKGVWFGGGRQWRFVDAYEGTLTEKRIQDVLKRGGVIAGSSAGASIQSQYMPRGHPLGNMVMAAEGYERGFGYLPGCAVDQHFFARKRTADLEGLIKQYPQFLGIGIDETTAIVVQKNQAEVLGKSRVAFYDGLKKGEKLEPVILGAGQIYDLKTRQEIKK